MQIQRRFAQHLKLEEISDTLNQDSGKTRPVRFFKALFLSLALSDNKLKVSSSELRLGSELSFCTSVRFATQAVLIRSPESSMIL